MSDEGWKWLGVVWRADEYEAWEAGGTIYVCVKVLREEWENEGGGSNCILADD